MKLRNKRGGIDKVDQQMTPMIDIVFQLLTFFVMSFKIASQEGDFNVKMPPSDIGTGPSPADPPLHLRLSATPEGRLGDLQFNSKSIGLEQGATIGFDRLHFAIMDMLKSSGPGMAENIELELDCDYDLHYANVVAAITAASGSVDESGHVVKLIEKIKLRPRTRNNQS